MTARDEMDEIEKGVQEMEAAYREYHILSEQARAAKERFDALACVTLPRLLQEAGVDHLALADSKEVRITKRFSCTTERGALDKEAIHAWLIAHGGGDLIKAQVNSSALKTWLKARCGFAGIPAQLTVDELPPQIHFTVSDEARIVQPRF